MAPDQSMRAGRRRILKTGSLACGALLLSKQSTVLAQEHTGLEVASAGSFRAVLEGPLKQAAAQALGLDLHSHAGGADAVARSIVDGTLAADVFIPITATPMRPILDAGKASVAYPIAATEMVILYSPKSQFASQFAAAAQGNTDLWSVLQQPGLRFARSNPLDDPSGRAILFTVALAAERLGQPGLVQKILGDPMNPAQVQAGINVRTALEQGTIDAAGSYRIATRLGAIPYVTLPPEVNLSDPQVRQHHPGLSIRIAEKTFYPDPLVFYAAVLAQAPNRAGAQRFVEWLRGKDAAALLQQEGFNSPGTSAELR